MKIVEKCNALFLDMSTADFYLRTLISGVLLGILGTILYGILPIECILALIVLLIVPTLLLVDSLLRKMSR